LNFLSAARYDASLAERRYAACDPDNRLIAAQLEKSWEATLARVQDCEARLVALQKPNPAPPTPDFTALAEDLEGTWNAPGVTMRSPTAVGANPHCRHHRQLRREFA
jgi:hypothetical protein